MDGELILIVLLSIAILAAVINLYEYWVKLRKAEVKKRLSNLYYPLHAILVKKNKYVLPLKSDPRIPFDRFAAAYYEIFLELKHRYLDHKLYESARLAAAFELLLEEHDAELCQEHREPHLPREVVENLGRFELRYRVDDRGLSQIERNMQRVEETIEKDISKMVKIRPRKKRLRRKPGTQHPHTPKDPHESQ